MNINSSFNAAALGGGADNVQDLEGFNYLALAGTPSLLTATPTIPANSFQYNNCSPCPIKLTITLPAPIPVGAKVAPADAEPVEKCKVLKPGESWSVSFKKDVILAVDIEEAEPPIAGIILDAAAVPVANATVDLDGNGTFLNC